MAAIKLTKNELKKQKDSLKRFRRYLPTLQLKKQQLQMVLMQIETQKKALEIEKAQVVENARAWIGVYADPGPWSPKSDEAGDLGQAEIDNRFFPVGGFLRISEIRTSKGNIAGIDIPVFESLTFQNLAHDLYETSAWVDGGIDFLQKVLEFDARLKVLDVQYRRVSNELRITSQRVNLFEKIKIPETRENIRRIQIYLGDQQTAAVVNGKIAKKNLLRGASA